MKKLREAWLILGIFLVLAALTQAGIPAAQAAGASTQTASAQASQKPSAAEIAAARAAGKVWVNLNTKIYHKGGRWYGKTKEGKFMTLDEAKKAGYKPAKRN